MPLIQDGVARAVVHDRHSAALAGAETTGHATAPGGHPQGPRPVNLVLAGGGAAGLDELCAPVERGIYVTRLWYANVVRPKQTLITAVTRDGTFLIEDGRVTRPLRDLRLTDSLLGILSRTSDLTAGQELTSNGEFYGRRFAHGVVCPGLRGGGAYGRRRFGEAEPGAARRRRCHQSAGRMPARSNLQQHDHVHHEDDRERDGPAVQVALHERAAPERAGARADAEGAGEAGVLARVHEYEGDHHHAQDDLKTAENCFHRPGSLAGGARFLFG